MLPLTTDGTVSTEGDCLTMQECYSSPADDVLVLPCTTANASSAHCAANSGQHFSWNANGSGNIHAAISGNAMCLKWLQPGAGLNQQPCNASDMQQQWTAWADGSVRTANGTLCLSPSSNATAVGELWVKPLQSPAPGIRKVAVLLFSPDEGPCSIML